LFKKWFLSSFKFEGREKWKPLSTQLECKNGTEEKNSQRKAMPHGWTKVTWFMWEKVNPDWKKKTLPLSKKW
jgi:hypothetical protein